MQNTIQHPHPRSLHLSYKISFTGFFSWCTRQHQNRLLWLAVSLFVQSCVMVPITLFVLSQADNSLILWTLPMVAIVMCLITNLAALPTKITIPVFILSIIIDIAVVAFCLVQMA